MNIWALIIFFAVLILALLLHRPSRNALVGICAVAFGQSSKKEERKEKILELLSQKEELSNSDIREALGVARRTAVRYCDELEAEGKIEQIGSAGQYVKYRLK